VKGRIGVALVVLAGAAALAGTALPSCWSLSDPLLDPGPDGGTGGAAGGGTGGSGASGGGGNAPCVPVHPPKAPDAGSTTTAGGWTFAIRAVRFEADPGETLGFDLDDHCTCPDPPSCIADVVGDAGADAGTHCDGPGGTDNTLGPALEEAVNYATHTAAERFTEGAEAGLWTLLIQLDESTVPDDPQVQIEALAGAACCGGNEPSWDGSDPWPTVADTNPATAAEAYLVGQVLVARFDLLEVPMRGDGMRLTIRMHDVVLSATLDTSPPIARLVDGAIVGEVTEDDLFTGLSSIEVDLTGTTYRLCMGNDDFYTGAKEAVCNARDLPAGDVGSSCERASIALGFTADEVGAGGTASIPALGTCPDGTDPIQDQCD